MLTAAAPAIACDDPTTLIASFESAVVEARLDDANTLSLRTEQAFGCAGLATATDLARWWRAEGALACFQGGLGSQDQAFASARRLAPSVWTPAFGEALEEQWATVEERLGGEGRLNVKDLPKGLSSYVDGQPAGEQNTLTEGTCSP